MTTDLAAWSGRGVGLPAGLVEAGEGGDVDTGLGLRGQGRPHSPGHHLEYNQ